MPERVGAIAEAGPGRLSSPGTAPALHSYQQKNENTTILSGPVRVLSSEADEAAEICCVLVACFCQNRRSRRFHLVSAQMEAAMTRLLQSVW